MKFANHVGLVCEPRVSGDLRPARGAILRANKRALQAPDAKRAFRGETDMLPEAGVQRPDSQAGHRSHVFDASAFTQAKSRSAIMISQCAGEEV